ncbi:MAG: hypothetical protein SNJ84_10540 [Verrucomicrobiia bacterium]
MIRPLAIFLTLAALAPALRAESTASADRIILVRLLHGQNDGIRDDLAQEESLKRSLTTLVGYRMYEEIGSAYASLDLAQPQFVVPCRAIYVKFQARGGNPPAFQFELFHSDRSLLQGEFIPRPSVPLIITGPFYDRGRLVLVMIHCPNQKIPPHARAHLAEKPATAPAPAAESGTAPIHQATPVSHPGAPR